jgi:hypothetical protein
MNLHRRAISLQHQSRIAQGRAPALFDQAALDHTLHPFPMEWFQNMRIGPTGRQSPISRKASFSLGCIHHLSAFPD